MGRFFYKKMNKFREMYGLAKATPGHRNLHNSGAAVLGIFVAASTKVNKMLTYPLDLRVLLW